MMHVETAEVDNRYGNCNFFSRNTSLPTTFYSIIKKKPLAFHTVVYKYTNPKNNCRGKTVENVREFLSNRI